MLILIGGGAGGADGDMWWCFRILLQKLGKWKGRGKGEDICFIIIILNLN